MKLWLLKVFWLQGTETLTCALLPSSFGGCQFSACSIMYKDQNLLLNWYLYGNESQKTKNNPKTQQQKNHPDLRGRGGRKFSCCRLCQIVLMMPTRWVSHPACTQANADTDEVLSSLLLILTEQLVMNITVVISGTSRSFCQTSRNPAWAWTSLLIKGFWSALTESLVLQQISSLWSTPSDINSTLWDTLPPFLIFYTACNKTQALFYLIMYGWVFLLALG